MPLDDRPRARPRGTEQRWTCKAGDASVVLVTPRVLRVEMRGHVDDTIAPGIAAGVAKHLEAESGLDTFWDFEALEHYHSTVRTELTSVLVKHRQRIGSLHALSRSRLVKMGVQVASLALGGIVRTYDERPPFDAAVRAATEAR